MNAFNIARAFRDKTARGWDRLYFCIDLHDVVIEGKYNRMNKGANYFPNAINVLSQLSYRKDIVLILWTSSHKDSIEAQLESFKAHRIEFRYINENPECPSNDLCAFDNKFYFNILLDDKAGFEGSTDWFLIEEEMKKANGWTCDPGQYIYSL